MKKTIGLSVNFKSFIRLISVSLAILTFVCMFTPVSAKLPDFTVSISGYTVTKVGASESVSYTDGNMLHRGENLEILVKIKCDTAEGIYGGKITVTFNSSYFALDSDKYIVGTPEDESYSYAVAIVDKPSSGWYAERETSTDTSITVAVTDPESSLLAKDACVSFKVALKVKETAAFAETNISSTGESMVLGGSAEITTSCTCIPFAVTVEKARPGKPAAPTFRSKTDTTITLTPIDGYEYKMGDGEWTRSNVFTGLKKNTEYTFYQRAYVSETSFGSESSDGFTTKTLEFATVKALIDSSAPYTYDDENGYIKGISDTNNSVAGLLANFADTSTIKIVNASGTDITSNTTAKLGTGTKIQMVDSDGTVVNELTVIVRGDVNGDGIINIVDCMKLRAAQLAKTNDVTGAFLQAGVDIVKNTTSLGVVHYMKLRAYQLAKITSFD